MGLNNYLSENVFLRCYDFSLSTSILSDLKLLDKSQWWTLNQLQEHQFQKLKKLLSHSYFNVPFYNQLYKKYNIHPQDINSLKDIQLLPIINKDDFRNQKPDYCLAKNISKKKLMRFNSSGSTGEPFEYYMCKKSYSIKYAAGIRGWSWMGYNLGDGYMKLSAVKRTSRLKNLQDFINRTLYVYLEDLKIESLRKAILSIIKHRLSYIRCYPDPLYFIAKLIILEGIDIGYKPKAINTTGNVLTADARKVIETAFNTKVYDSYTVEGAAMFYQGPSCKNYLGAMEQSLTEIITQNSNPGKGLHVTTDLNNMAMPFIRYNTQDIIELADEQENDGRHLFAIKKILGRDSDLLYTENGNVLYVHMFTGYFEYFNSIKQFQILQRGINDYLFNLVVVENFNMKTENEIIKYWKNYIGGNVNIEIETLDEIPLLPSGKRKFLIRNKSIKSLY